MRTLLSVVCVLTVFACSQASAAIVGYDVFDEFGIGQNAVGFAGSASSMTPGLTTGDFASTVDRTISITAAAGVNAIFVDNGGNDLFEVSGATTYGFSILWDSITPSLDLTSMTSFILTDVVWTGASDLDLELVLNGSGTEISSATVSAGTSGGAAEFFLSDFTAGALGNLTSVELRNAPGSGQISGMLSSESLVVTPEPSSIVLAGLGLAALLTASYIRRRKQQLEPVTTAA